jgi:hypothetical protein
MIDDLTPLFDRTDRLRQEMIAFIDTLDAHAAALELPKPPDALQHSRDKLVKNAYTVLVAARNAAPSN